MQRFVIIDIWLCSQSFPRDSMIAVLKKIKIHVLCFER